MAFQMMDDEYAVYHSNQELTEEEREMLEEYEAKVRAEAGECLEKGFTT